MRREPQKPDPIDMIVARRIRELRIFAGLSQAELGEALGVSPQQINKLELGINRAKAGHLFLIAERLGVPVNDLFDDAPAVTGTGQGAMLTLRLMKSVDRLAPEMRASIAALVAAVAQQGRG